MEGMLTETGGDAAMTGNRLAEASGADTGDF